MDEERWTEVDAYIEAQLLGDADWAEAVLASNAAAKLAAIDVSPAQGKLLHLLVRISGARRVLEIGTLGGYSTIWMAKALPADGRIVTIEIDPRTAEVARANFDRAGVADRAGSADPMIVGTRALFDLLGRETGLTSTAVQTVGRKGWDGFAIAVVG